MKSKLKFFVLIMIVVLSMGTFISVYAASGTCEVFYFTYSGSVGEGGSASIKSYLSNLGYSANRYANTHAYYVRRTMNNDKVFAIVSHGAPGRVFCKDEQTTVSANSVSSDSDNYSLAANFGSNAFSGMKFAYYGACQTAKTDSTYGNLLTYTTGTLGAKCALGFDKSVMQTQATYYEKKLFQYLAGGYTVSKSNNLAQTATYNKYGSYGKIDSAVVKGNGNTKIN